MLSEEIGNTVECRVGVRETLAGDGSVHRRLTIHCELRGGAVDLATCAGCDHFVGVLPSAHGRSAVVQCHRPDGDPSTTTNAARPTLVGSVMERDIVCVTSDVGVDTIAALLLAWGASGVPVVDASGHPIGMISWEDLMRARPGLAAAGRSVGEVMTPFAFALEEGSEFSRAAQVMSGEGFHQLPVLMGDGSVGGLLSTCAVAQRVVRAEKATG
jgi:CBS domain-containing protein